VLFPIFAELGGEELRVTLVRARQHQVGAQPPKIFLVVFGIAGGAFILSELHQVLPQLGGDVVEDSLADRLEIDRTQRPIEVFADVKPEALREAGAALLLFQKNPQVVQPLPGVGFVRGIKRGSAKLLT